LFCQSGEIQFAQTHIPQIFKTDYICVKV